MDKSPLLLPWITFADFVHLRSTSKTNRDVFKVGDMLKIMRNRLPSILYYDDHEMGSRLVDIMIQRNLLLSGSRAISFIFDECYCDSDIDLYYNESINKDWDQYETASYHKGDFTLLNFLVLREFPNVQVIKNMSLPGNTHDVIVGNFDMSYVKNTVSFVDGRLTIEISNRNTLRKKGYLAKQHTITHKTIERAAKYESRGFYTKTSSAPEYTCTPSVHPTASMISALKEPPKECSLTHAYAERYSIPFISIDGKPTCFLHDILRNTPSMNPAISRI